jgi:hypothetical protein
MADRPLPEWGGEPYGGSMSTNIVATGRRCQHLGCPTLLSAYNPDLLCWTHADQAARSRFDRVAHDRVDQPFIYRQRKDGVPPAPIRGVG